MRRFILTNGAKYFGSFFCLLLHAFATLGPKKAEYWANIPSFTGLFRTASSLVA